MSVPSTGSPYNSSGHSTAHRAAPVRRRRVLRALFMLGVVAAALGAAWMARAPLLRGAATLWAVSDDYTAADAVVVLGGGLESRPFAAADLYKRGLAKHVLVLDVWPGAAERLEIIPRQGILARDILLRIGIPAQAITVHGNGVANTYEEARAVRDWAARTGGTSVIVPTEEFSSRRVRWMFRRELADAGVRVGIKVLTPAEYGAENWWTREKGILAFQNEIMKYLYYRLK